MTLFVKYLANFGETLVTYLQKLDQYLALPLAIFCEGLKFWHFSNQFGVLIANVSSVLCYFEAAAEKAKHRTIAAALLQTDATGRASFNQSV